MLTFETNGKNGTVYILPFFDGDSKILQDAALACGPSLGTHQITQGRNPGQNLVVVVVVVYSHPNLKSLLETCSF